MRRLMTCTVSFLAPFLSLPAISDPVPSAVVCRWMERERLIPASSGAVNFLFLVSGTPGGYCVALKFPKLLKPGQSGVWLKGTCALGRESMTLETNLASYSCDVDSYFNRLYVRISEMSLRLPVFSLGEMRYAFASWHGYTGSEPARPVRFASKPDSVTASVGLHGELVLDWLGSADFQGSGGFGNRPFGYGLQMMLTTFPEKTLRFRMTADGKPVLYQSHFPYIYHQLLNGL